MGSATANRRSTTAVVHPTPDPVADAGHDVAGLVGQDFRFSGLDSTGVWNGSQSQKVFTQTGDDTAVGGQGNNRFAMRIAGANRKP